jgi:RNA polymerase-binding transcription factor DksA
MRAANRALKYSATGVECQNSYRKYVRVAVAAAIKEQRRLEAEIKKLEQNSYVYCRDGDGDGICFED